MVQQRVERPFDRPPATDWPAPRHDRGRTGYAAAATAPEPPLGVRWRTALPTSEREETGDRASPPVVADGRVIVATADGVIGLRFEDGSEAWRATVRPKVSSSTFGYGKQIATPVVGPDGDIYMPGHDAVFALDPADGSERWRYDVPQGPADHLVVGDAVYAVIDNAVVAIDRADRSRLWTGADGGAGVPAVGDGTVVVPHDELRGLDAATGEERWRSPIRPEFPPVVGDGVAYAGSYEGLHAVDLTDGTTRWTFERGSGRSFSAPVVADDTIYAVERPGEAGMATFALDPADGTPAPRWCSAVGDGAVTAATPERAFGALGGGAAPGDEGPPLRLVAFEQRFGNTEWGLAGRERLLPPAVVDGAVVVVDRTGTVSALGEV